MKTPRKIKTIPFIVVAFSFLVLQSCGGNKNSEEKEQAEIKTESVIEIITEVMDFQTVDEIPAGWHSFRYVNKSNEPHFFLLGKYPEGKTIKDGEREVIPTFQNGMNLINEGKAEEGFAEFNKLPPWFFEVVYSGGSGLISSGKTSETTLKLEPGYYVMECYVKMIGGVFHSSMGMAKELIVTENTASDLEITPDVKLTISSTEGIVFSDPVNKGKQIFSVYFKDQVAHENFVGHDVNLVKLNENANLETLEKWMNWADPEGLITPAPQGVTFFGGVNEMPAGNTGYFSATLEPGNYALVSEVPNTLSKNMLKTFSVAD
jgi:hypothetical protein